MVRTHIHTYIIYDSESQVQEFEEAINITQNKISIHDYCIIELFIGSIVVKLTNPVT